MFNEYEEYYTEPSEAELIIEEAKEKLLNLLTDEVKETMDKVAKAKKQLEKLNGDIQDKGWKLKHLTEKIADMETRLELAETKEMPKKYIAKFVKDATGDFAPGDKVWYLQYKPLRTDCPDCHGKKKVTANVLGKETEVTCPTCDGYGYIRKDDYEIVEKRVSEVKLKLCFYEDRVNYWSRECVYLNGHESYTKPEHIFKTKEEAEEKLKELCN